MPDNDITGEICERVKLAGKQGRWLQVNGSSSKIQLMPLSVPGIHHDQKAEILTVKDHTGIERYEPAELVLSVRAGTSLKTIESTLRQQHQQLAFEPPQYQGKGTIGGAVAMGLAGPGRPWLGGVADAMLGVRLVNGLGQALRFGGEVMKNVAGFDVTRLQVGARGSLGALLSVSLRVMPMPEMEATRVLSLPLETALRQLREWARLPLPITASAWYEGRLYLRLAGPASTVRAASAKIGGDDFPEPGFWNKLRDQQLDWFRQGAVQKEKPLIRLTVAPAAPASAVHQYLDGDITLAESSQLIEWGGGLRWFFLDEGTRLRQFALDGSPGKATVFRVPADLNPESIGDYYESTRLARRIKAAFDPHGIFQNTLVLDANQTT